MAPSGGRGTPHAVERQDTDCWGLQDRRSLPVFRKKLSLDPAHRVTVYTINTFRSRGLPQREGEEVAGHELIA